MFGLIKEMFVELLISIVKAPNQTKCVLLSNQKCDIQPTFLNLHPNEYSQEFHYYTFELENCVKICNSLNDISNNESLPNKTEDLNLNVFNMVTGINESKELTKHIS